MTRECPYCNEPLSDNVRYCSTECETGDAHFVENERRAEARRNPSLETLNRLLLRICSNCGSGYKSEEGGKIYCTDACKTEALEDRRKNGPICVQCDRRYKKNSFNRSVRYCADCSENRDKERFAAREEKLRQENERYQDHAAAYSAFIEDRIRNRELRSMSQLKAEHRAQLRHYAELTAAIDKGELVNVVRK